MSANTVTVAASAVSATNTASLAATMTITAASIRAAASIAASIAQRSHHAVALGCIMQSACIHPMVYIWYHMEWYHRIPYVPYIYKPRENINGTVHNAVEGGKGGGGKDAMRAYKDGGPTQGAR